MSISASRITINVREGTGGESGERKLSSEIDPSWPSSGVADRSEPYSVGFRSSEQQRCVCDASSFDGEGINLPSSRKKRSISPQELA